MAAKATELTTEEQIDTYLDNFKVSAVKAIKAGQHVTVTTRAKTQADPANPLEHKIIENHVSFTIK